VSGSSANRRDAARPRWPGAWGSPPPIWRAWRPGQRGLSLEDFIAIVEVLGEKRLAAVSPDFLPRVAAIIGKIVVLTEDVGAAAKPRQRKARR